MARYYFDLSDGAARAHDECGNELPDHLAAIAYGHEIARELMRNNEQRSRQLCITVYGEERELLFTLPFVVIDDTISGLPPESRVLLEICYERRRKLAEAMHGARRAVRQSRALIARARRKPYLAAADGEAVL